MPTRLKVLIAVLAVALAGNALALRPWAAALAAVQLSGALWGTRGARLVATSLSVLGMISSAVLLFAGLAFDPLAAPVALLGMAQHALTLWCLQDARVHDWLGRRSAPTPRLNGPQGCR